MVIVYSTPIRTRVEIDFSRAQRSATWRGTFSRIWAAVEKRNATRRLSRDMVAIWLDRDEDDEKVWFDRSLLLIWVYRLLPMRQLPGEPRRGRSTIPETAEMIALASALWGDRNEDLALVDFGSETVNAIAAALARVDARGDMMIVMDAIENPSRSHVITLLEIWSLAEDLDLRIHQG